VPDLIFQVREAEAVFDAATPAVALRLEVSNRPAEELVETVVLRCQIQIETPRRHYTDREQDKLRDLFGEPERWGQTLRPMLWTNITSTLPAFSGSAAILLVAPCTFDFNVTASKYFYGLEDGTVPITLLFSGTVFYRSPTNQLQVAPISWNTEARFPFPVGVWKQSIDLHYPNMAWLRLRRDVFDRLYDFKVQQGLATFDEAIERMIEAKLEVGF
jgi:hypothetical protein